MAPATWGGEGGDWPQFHGPRRDNRSTETGLLKTWPADGPRLVWTARGVGHGFATVALSGGRIYTSGNRDGRTIVSALDLDGRPIWQVENGEAWEASVPGTRLEAAGGPSRDSFSSGRFVRREFGVTRTEKKAPQDSPGRPAALLALEWRRRDSNPRHADYDSAALTD